MESQPYSLSPEQIRGLQRDPSRRLAESLQLARRRDPSLPRYLREYEKPLQPATESGDQGAHTQLVLSIQDIGMFGGPKRERIDFGVRLTPEGEALGKTNLFYLRKDERFAPLFEQLDQMEQNGDIPKAYLQQEGGYEKLAGILREMEAKGYWNELVAKARQEANAWEERKRRMSGQANKD